MKKKESQKVRAKRIALKLADMANTSSNPKHQRQLLKRFGKVVKHYDI